ncbi:MAG TPA: hypothetical protein VLA71_16980 [Algoriphagus sp.]|nr:hypothetical protein [Algoriphagus sp.]
MDENAPVPKRKINVEFLLGLSAVFLSASALIVSIIQTTIFKEQQYASVWPYLQTTLSSRSGNYDYGIENKGVGPAIVKKFEYVYRGTSYDNTRALFTALFGENMKGVGFSGVNKDYVFKPEEAISLLSLDNPDSVIRQIAYRWESASVNLKVTYSDVYGNCWLLDNGVTTRLSSFPD